MDKKQEAKRKKNTASYRCLMLTVCCLFFSSAAATAIEGLPGSTWGRAAYDASGVTGSGFNGWVNQGIDWVKLTGDVTFNTYVEYRYRARTEQNKYYDANGPAIGIAFKKSFFEFGMDYYQERFPKLNETSDNNEIYLTWYYDWDLKKSGIINFSEIEGFSGSTWGRAVYDTTGLTGSGFNGWVNQGIDWVKLPGDVTFNTYVEYRYRAREKEDAYYNVYGPAIGLEFRKSVFRLGMDYYWEKYPEINQNSESLEIYLTWYYNWNLKKQ